jgi:hypothetical protein
VKQSNNKQTQPRAPALKYTHKINNVGITFVQQFTNNLRRKVCEFLPDELADMIPTQRNSISGQPHQGILVLEHILVGLWRIMAGALSVG